MLRDSAVSSRKKLITSYSSRRSERERTINLRLNLSSSPLKVFRGTHSALTEDEPGSLMKSKHFSDFFNQSTKLLEKVLDKGDGEMLELLLTDDINGAETRSKDILSPAVKFFDAHYTQNRVVTSLDWSPQIP